MVLTTPSSWISQHYVSTSEIRLFGVVGATEIDGRRDLHAHLAFEHASTPGGLVMPLGSWDYKDRF